MKRFILLIFFFMLTVSPAQASFWDNEASYINYDYVDESTVLTWELNHDFPLYEAVADITVTSTVFLDDPFPRIEIRLTRVFDYYDGTPDSTYDWYYTLNLEGLPATPHHIKFTQELNIWETSYAVGISSAYNYEIIDGPIPSIATPEVTPLFSMGLGLLILFPAAFRGVEKKDSC